MKKITVILTLMLVISLPVFSQVSFSGTADISIGANIPESSDYSSILAVCRVDKPS